MITIIGMSMPRNCNECPMTNNYENMCVLHDGVPAHKQSNTDRPSWCPLTDVSFPKYCQTLWQKNVTKGNNDEGAGMEDLSYVLNEFEQYCDSLDESCPIILLDVLDILKKQKKVGKWVCFLNNGAYDYKCSECGMVLTLGMSQSRYCPNCGSKMG